MYHCLSARMINRNEKGARYGKRDTPKAFERHAAGKEDNSLVGNSPWPEIFTREKPAFKN